MNRKLIFPTLALVIAVLACSIQPGTVAPVTQVPANATNTPMLPVVPTDTSNPTENPTASPLPVPPPALPVIASPALIDIKFQDANNGWGLASNNSGYLLRTVDGGVTWMNATPPGITVIGSSSSFFVLDDNHVWLQAPSTTDFYNGTLYYTSDGGATWTSSSVPFGGATLQFLDANTGRALADRGAGAGSNAVEMFQTSDGGATWTSVFHNDPSQAGSSDSLPLGGIKSGVTFLDANTGWVTGSRPMDGDVYLFVTHDGGISWAQQSIPLPAGYETYQYMTQAPVFFGMDGFLPLVIYLPGSVNFTLYISHDGGASWNGNPEDANQVISSSGLYSIADAMHTWVWDGGNALYRTYDGGSGNLYWEGLIPNLNLSGVLTRICFVSDGTGWALTNVDDTGHSKLYQSQDGGANWNPLIP